MDFERLLDRKGRKRREKAGKVEKRRISFLGTGYTPSYDYCCISLTHVSCAFNYIETVFLNWNGSCDTNCTDIAEATLFDFSSVFLHF